MSASLALEKDLTIAYFGPEATNTHQAARSKFGASVRYVPEVSIADVFDVVARGNADYGVVPIENSTEGAVNHTLDMFMESDLRICAQILLKIENHLIAKIPKEEIRKLYSHPQVFGQCRNWLRHNLPDVDLDRSLDHPSRGGTRRHRTRRRRDRGEDGRGSVRAGHPRCRRSRTCRTTRRAFSSSRSIRLRRPAMTAPR